MKRFFLIILSCFAACLLSMPFAEALPTFPAIVMKTYQSKAGGAVATAKCLLCHVQVPKLNPYGRDVKAALDAAGTKNLTPEILHSIEDKDSDGDGATNAQEFAADTLPGNAASKPKIISATVKTSGTNTADSGSEPGPWSLQTLLFPRHAQHPVIVHFPIALLLIALFFDFLGIRTKNRALNDAGYFNLSAAALSAPVTVLTGLGAWWFKYDHSPLQGDLLYHLIMGIVSMLLIWGLWGLRRKELRGEKTTFSLAYITLGVLAIPIISITGHLGGILAGA